MYPWLRHVLQITASILGVCAIIILAPVVRDLQFVSAVKRGDSAAAESFLHRGANPDAFDIGGTTALQYAAHSGDVTDVQLLLSYGAKPGGALVSAVTGGHTDVLQQLVDARPRASHALRASALELALQEGKQDCAKIIRDSGNQNHPPNEKNEEATINLVSQ